jgi:hypothetical protein
LQEDDRVSRPGYVVFRHRCLQEIPDIIAGREHPRTTEFHIKKITEPLRFQRNDRYVFVQPMRDRAMHPTPELQADTPSKSEVKLPAYVRIGGLVFRTLFLIVLTVLTARVASPQIEHLSSLYETPGDLVRVILGFAVCVWFVANLFILPKDAGAYRTWLYLGLALLPLSLLCVFVGW